MSIIENSTDGSVTVDRGVFWIPIDENAQMLFRVYAKWIDGADQGREAAALNAAQKGNRA